MLCRAEVARIGSAWAVITRSMILKAKLIAYDNFVLI